MDERIPVVATTDMHARSSLVNEIFWPWDSVF